MTDCTSADPDATRRGATYDPSVMNAVRGGCMRAASPPNRAVGLALPCSAHRQAFALIELLVTVGVIGLLIGLILPAVQGAREAARRAQCVNNLRQIGTAMHSYHAVHNMFPPSQLLLGPRWGASTISAFTFILPQLERPTLFSSINFEFYPYDQHGTPVVENATARNTRLAVFVCPSDGEPEHANNYRLNRGKLDPRGRYLYSGPFGLGRLPSQASITDGLSRTAFVSERIGGSFREGAEDPVRDIRWPIPPHPAFGTEEAFIPFCLSTAQVNWQHTAGRYWFYAGMLDTDYNHNGPPNDRRPSCGSDEGLQPPRSFHGGGVNLLLGDGHTEWVSDSIDARVWQNLGTASAGD